MVLIASHCIGVKIEVLLLMGDLYAVCYLLHPIVIVLGVVKMSKIEVVRIGFSHCLCVFFCLSEFYLLLHICIFLPFSLFRLSFSSSSFVFNDPHTLKREKIFIKSTFSNWNPSHTQSHIRRLERKKNSFFFLF